MSKPIHNIALPNNKVEAVAGVHKKAFIAFFHRQNLSPIASTTLNRVPVGWEVYFLNRLLYKLDSPKSTSQIPMVTKGKFKNSFDKKCEQCPLLTTHDLHGESKQSNVLNVKVWFLGWELKRLNSNIPLNAGM